MESDLCSSSASACMCHRDWLSPESAVPATGRSHTGLRWWRKSASSAFCPPTSLATDTQMQKPERGINVLLWTTINFSTFYLFPHNHQHRFMFVLNRHHSIWREKILFGLIPNIVFYHNRLLIFTTCASIASLGMEDALMDAVLWGDLIDVGACLACCSIWLYSMTSGTYTKKKRAGCFWVTTSAYMHQYSSSCPNTIF